MCIYIYICDAEAGLVRLLRVRHDVVKHITCVCVGYIKLRPCGSSNSVRSNYDDCNSIIIIHNAVYVGAEGPCAPSSRPP